MDIGSKFPCMGLSHPYPLSCKLTCDNKAGDKARQSLTPPHSKAGFYSQTETIDKVSTNTRHNNNTSSLSHIHSISIN